MGQLEIHFILSECVYCCTFALFFLLWHIPLSEYAPGDLLQCCWSFVWLLSLAVMNKAAISVVLCVLGGLASLRYASRDGTDIW